MRLTPRATLSFLAAAAAAPSTKAQEATCLYQADFAQGTKIISAPGSYKLCEDVTFDPSPPLDGAAVSADVYDPPLGAAGDPAFASPGAYSANGYALGFFAAVTVASSDVTIDLNGFKIEQSEGHALMQRFFAVIELASSPFIPGVGPAQFVGEGEEFVPAKNVRILGPGEIGRSSHHGIHGNENSNIYIHGVTFRDFEVAAVHLNNVDGLEISNCDVPHNRHDVPVVGMFSAARMIRPYGKYLKEIGYAMDLYNPATGLVESKTAAQAYDDLLDSIDAVYDDVIRGSGSIDPVLHHEEHRLYHNPVGAVDGPCYVFVVHGKGPAVGGQGTAFSDDPAAVSSDILIKNNRVRNVKCWNNEVPALMSTCGGGHGCIANDARGAVFQTVKTFDPADPYLATNDAGTYDGNVVSDMQLMTAKAILDGVLVHQPDRQVAANAINQEIIDWAQGNNPAWVPQYICNGDSMHHVVKGMILFRVEDTAGFVVDGNTVGAVENLSAQPFTNCAGYHVGASLENVNEAQQGNVRIISSAANSGYATTGKKSRIQNNIVGTASSANANVIIGVDVQGDSEGIVIARNYVDLVDDAFGANEALDPFSATTSPTAAPKEKGDPKDDRRRLNVFAEKYIGLRLRESTISVDVKSSNDFRQPVQTLNAARRLRKARETEKPSHHPPMYEWENGGCPMAAEYAKRSIGEL